MEEKIINETQTVEENIPYNVVNHDIPDSNNEMSDEERKFTEELNEKYKDEPIPEFGSEEADVIVDENGKRRVVEAGTAVTDVNIDPDGANTMELLMHPEQRDHLINDKTISEDKISNELKNTYDLSDEEIMSMISILNKMQNGKNFSVYNEMPEKMQNLVKAAMLSNNIPATPENRNMISKSLIEDILADIKNDDSFIEFNEALKEIANIPSLMDFHAENCVETMEKKLPETAEKIKDTNPEKAAALLKIKDSWVETYNFTLQHRLLDTSERVRNRITTDVANYKDFIRKFTDHYESSKFVINDVNQVTKVLFNLMPERDIDHLKAFTILLIKACDTYHPDKNKPEDISFVYNSIKNIIALDFIEVDHALEFNKLLIANINTLLDKIAEIDAANKERMANDPIAQKKAKRAKKKHHH